MVDSFLLAKDGDYVQKPLPEAARYLRDLLDAYWSGLSRFLVFFPQTSLAYATSVHGGKAGDRAIRDALKPWAGSGSSPGESEDRYFRLAFRDEINAERIPRIDEFEATASKLMEPLVGNQEPF